MNDIKINYLLDQQAVLDKHFSSLEQQHTYPTSDGTAFSQVGIK